MTAVHLPDVKENTKALSDLSTKVPLEGSIEEKPPLKLTSKDDDSIMVAVGQGEIRKTTPQTRWMVFGRLLTPTPVCLITRRRR